MPIVWKVWVTTAEEDVDFTEFRLMRVTVSSESAASRAFDGRQHPRLKRSPRVNLGRLLGTPVPRRHPAQKLSPPFNLLSTQPSAP